jgi:DNA-binding NarL/FixJ family response regulator
MMRKPRVLIADDHRVVAEGVQRLLQGDCKVVGLAFDGEELLTKTKALKPDLVIADLVMPGKNGLEATREIKKSSPSIKVIFLSQQSGKGLIEAAFAAGASGYVSKQSVWRELKTAIRDVMRGNSYVSEASLDGIPESEGRLTPRQRQVLLLIAEGKSIKEIAAALGISVKTVEFHKAAIVSTVGKRTTAELTRFAMQVGLIIDAAGRGGGSEQVAD